MKKIFLFLILTISIFNINNIYWNNEEIDPKVEERYNKFIIKIEKKYTSIEKQILVYTEVNKLLNKAVKSSKIKPEEKEVLNDFIALNSKKLAYLKIKNQILNNSKIEEQSKNQEKINEENFKLKYEQNNNYLIDKYSITKNFTKKSYNKDNIFIENWVWYYYKVDQYKYFKDTQNLKVADLDYNWINSKTSLVFMINNEQIWFTDDVKKIKLISDNIIYWVPNKYEFLLEIKDDKKELTWDTDELFKNLKNETISLTTWLTNEKKIEAIYNYILDKLEYTKVVNFENHEIFSWIITYKNKTWVCEWYAKLFIYMLNFSWIWNAELIRWNVIDAVDFPKIWHAWLKIDDKYYDPTFDDPIWLTKTRTINEYQYFWLPKDLFYTNRFTYEETPENLKIADLWYRQNYVKQNLIQISEKYKNNDYVLLREINFKKKYNINPTETITIANLGKIFPLYEIKDFKTKINWVNKTITKINYYKIEDSTLGDLIKQINYNTTWYYFFKWDLGDWNYEYRLWYNVIFN